MATTMPPLAVPSSLVSTTPLTSTACLNSCAWRRPFWPVVASRTSRVSCGAPGSCFSMTRRIFSSSRIRLTWVCRRPAVVYDGVAAARSRGVDVVLIDTAGRLHTQVNLMRELERMRRVIEKQLPGAPHETLLVLDATTGQNGLRQAQEFKQAVDVSGVVLTKLDGTAKGGIVVAIHETLGIPIKLIGIGEQLEDLRPFEPDVFARAIFGGGAERVAGHHERRLPHLLEPPGDLADCRGLAGAVDADHEDHGGLRRHVDPLRLGILRPQHAGDHIGELVHEGLAHLDLPVSYTHLTLPTN